MSQRSTEQRTSVFPNVDKPVNMENALALEEENYVPTFTEWTPVAIRSGAFSGSCGEIEMWELIFFSNAQQQSEPVLKIEEDEDAWFLVR